MVIVTKFGGTSVKDGQSIDRVIDILFRDIRRRVVVVSAPAGLTDRLINFANSRYNSNLGQSPDIIVLMDRFRQIADYFAIDHGILEDLYLRSYKAAIVPTVKSREEYQDAIAVFGERINAVLVAEAIKKRKPGAKTRVVRPEDMGMYTDSNFGDARLNELSPKLIRKHFDSINLGQEIVIVPGYYGIDRDGRAVTFGRDGSNYTAAVLASSLEAELMENFSDQMGICRANPEIVDEAKDDIIRELNYWEARELAYSGSKILHPRTIVPLAKARVPVRVRSTFNYEDEGTLIHEIQDERFSGIKGIAEKTMYRLRIEKLGMDDIHGYGMRILKIFDELGIDFHQQAGTVDSLAYTFTLPPSNGEAGQKLDMLKLRIKDDPVLSPDNYEVTQSTVICVVGEGIQSQVGLAGRLQNALEKEKINLIGIIHGPSPRSLIYEVAPQDARKAVQTLYRACRNLR